MARTICRCTSCVCPNFTDVWKCEDCEWGIHSSKFREANCPNCGEENIEIIKLVGERVWRYCRNCEWSIDMSLNMVGVNLPINYTEIGLIEVAKKVYW